MAEPPLLQKKSMHTTIAKTLGWKENRERRVRVSNHHAPQQVTYPSTLCTRSRFVRRFPILAAAVSCRFEWISNRESRRCKRQRRLAGILLVAGSIILNGDEQEGRGV